MLLFKKLSWIQLYKGIVSCVYFVVHNIMYMYTHIEYLASAMGFMCSVGILPPLIFDKRLENYGGYVSELKIK